MDRNGQFPEFIGFFRILFYQICLLGRILDDVVQFFHYLLGMFHVQSYQFPSVFYDGLFASPFVSFMVYVLMFFLSPFSGQCR